jgi:hypothetical protein
VCCCSPGSDHGAAPARRGASLGCWNPAELAAGPAPFSLLPNFCLVKGPLPHFRSSAELLSFGAPMPEDGDTSRSKTRSGKKNFRSLMPVNPAELNQLLGRYQCADLTVFDKAVAAKFKPIFPGGVDVGLEGRQSE